MEFLLVKFPSVRDVLADDQEVGDTNTTLMLPPGEYSVTLSGEGYEPDFQDVVLAGTSGSNPKVIVFTQVAVPAPMAVAATAPAPAKPKPKAGPRSKAGTGKSKSKGKSR
jgi:hypothetical protein